MAEHSENPLAHVIDHDTITLPWWNPPSQLTDHQFERVFDLPQIAGFQITHFMLMELIAAVLPVFFLVPVAFATSGRTPYTCGWFMNMFEAMLLFIRDDVARRRSAALARRSFLAIPLDGFLLRIV